MAVFFVNSNMLLLNCKLNSPKSCNSCHCNGTSPVTVSRVKKKKKKRDYRKKNLLPNLLGERDYRREKLPPALLGEVGKISIAVSITYFSVN